MARRRHFPQSAKRPTWIAGKLALSCGAAPKMPDMALSRAERPILRALL